MLLDAGSDNGVREFGFSALLSLRLEKFTLLVEGRRPDASSCGQEWSRIDPDVGSLPDPTQPRWPASNRGAQRRDPAARPPFHPLFVDRKSVV